MSRLGPVTVLLLASLPAQSEPDGGVSLAVLERSARKLEQADLLAAAKRAFGAAAFADRDQGYAVVERDMGVVRHRDVTMFVSVSDEQAFADSKKLAAEIGELRLREAVLAHRAVLRVYVPGADKSRTRDLRAASKLVAELLDENSLALSFSTEPRLFAVTESTAGRLRESNPVRAMIRPDAVPILPADGDEQAELDKAAEQARGDWQKLLDAWAQDQSAAAVKMTFREGEKVEHMWVSVEQLDEHGGKGKLGNSPAWLEKIKEGDPVTFKKVDVQDWLIKVGKQRLGGYSVELLAAQAKRRQERATARKAGGESGQSGAEKPVKQDGKR